jgi:pimeloyl-ACP methyl ester carboxylesterase
MAVLDFTPKMPGQLITHPNGQTSHVVIDDFTDPWETPETIFIQPGFGRHHGFWYHWIPALARHYRVVRRDLRGHGYSSCPGPDYDYSLETVLAEIVDTLDQLHLEKVHVLGESTGGMVAVAFAGNYPSRCLSLTTCATPTHLPQSAQTEWAVGYPNWETACRKLGSKAYMETLSKMPGGIGQDDLPYNRWWGEQIGISTGEGLARYARFLSTLDIRPFYQDVERAKLPVLILAPTQSRNTSIMDQKQQQRSMEGSKLVEINGRGHEIYVDKAAECQQALLNFIRSVRKEVV